MHPACFTPSASVKLEMQQQYSSAWSRPAAENSHHRISYTCPAKTQYFSLINPLESDRNHNINSIQQHLITYDLVQFNKRRRRSRQQTIIISPTTATNHCVDHHHNAAH